MKETRKTNNTQGTQNIYINTKEKTTARHVCWYKKTRQKATELCDISEIMIMFTLKLCFQYDGNSQKEIAIFQDLNATPSLIVLDLS